MVINEMAPSEDPPNKAEAPFSIRRMRPEDYGTVAAIWKAADLPHQPQGRDSEMRVREQLEKDISLYLVAESDGEVIGSLLVTHDFRKGWLNRLAVRPDRQGRGVASSLVRRAEKDLLARGVGIFAVQIHGHNLTSRRLFKKLGYDEHEDIVYCSRRISPDE